MRADVADGGGIGGRGERQGGAGGFEAEPRGGIGQGDSGGARGHVQVAVPGGRHGDPSGCAEEAARGVERGEIEARGRGRCGRVTASGITVTSRGRSGGGRGGGGAAAAASPPAALPSPAAAGAAGAVGGTAASALELVAVAPPMTANLCTAANRAQARAANR